MRRLISLGAAALLVSGCGSKHSAAELASEAEKPHSLETLLKWHDVAVAEQGKDLYFIKPIGKYGRDGVLASLNHLGTQGMTVSSYNGIELIFGVASEAKLAKDYNICEDKTTLQQIADGARSANAPAWERSSFEGFLKEYCKPKG